MPRSPLYRVVAWIGVLLIALYVITVAIRAVPLQWDFRTYLTAAKTARAGLDPYVNANLSHMAGRAILPFLYPPIALLPFIPLSTLPPEAAHLAWVALKVLLLAGLIFLWKRRFVPGVETFPLTVIAVFGSCQSAIWDIRTGNVALVEAMFVWLAMLAYVRDRRGVFACLIVAAALFKLWPAFLLLLLLVPAGGRRTDVRGFALALAALFALVWMPTWIGPAAGWTHFLSIIPSANRLGANGPGALALATMIADTPGGGEPTVRLVAAGIWVLYLAVLAAVSFPFLRRTWNERDSLRWTMAAVFLWVLLAPRPMVYGYAVLTPAPLFFSPRPFHGRIGLLLLAIVLSAQGLLQAAHHESPNPILAHSPFILALCVWLLVVSAPPSRTPSDDSRPRPSPSDPPR